MIKMRKSIAEKVENLWTEWAMLISLTLGGITSVLYYFSIIGNLRQTIAHILL